MKRSPAQEIRLLLEYGPENIRIDHLGASDPWRPVIEMELNAHGYQRVSENLYKKIAPEGAKTKYQNDRTTIRKESQ